MSAPEEKKPQRTRLQRKVQNAAYVARRLEGLKLQRERRDAKA